MSSLALSAAPFLSNKDPDDMASVTNSVGSQSEPTGLNSIERARRRYTIKNRNDNDDKVSDMMSYIHKNLDNGDEDEDSNMNSFNPPEPPTSIGAERRKETDPNLPENKTLKEGEMAQSNMSELVSDEPVDQDAYSLLPDTSKSEYYEKIAPLYKELNEHKGVSAYTNKSELTQKLNYMIHLLEEQQDERTGHVFEELILYSFLGIFIIFVVDSFARAGKYVR